MRSSGGRRGASGRATVVGSGPNGLAAAVVLARAGLQVEVLEAAGAPGGGARTEALMPGGWLYDPCSAVHPSALSSGFFRAFRLADRIALAVPEVSFAHALGRGESVLAWRSLSRTVDDLGRDGTRYRRLVAPLVDRWEGVVSLAGGSIPGILDVPLAAAAFGRAIAGLWGRGPSLGFAEGRAAALVAGVAAHSAGDPRDPAFLATGLKLLTEAHSVGWPIPIGGSGAITDALVADLQQHGGVVRTGIRVRSLADIDPEAMVFLDIPPATVLAVMGDSLPPGYRRRLSYFRMGPGAAKVDFALDGPVPWADMSLAGVPTVHVGGPAADVWASELAVNRGQLAERPYVLVVQPSVLDPSRAPDGGHVVWAYLHVPNGNPASATRTVIKALEMCAPGFSDRVVHARSTPASKQKLQNANYLGGDILGGAVNLPQLVGRPVVSREPWSTPLDGIFLCSASTAPGPGVHGQCGFQAARIALRDVHGIHNLPDLSPTAPACNQG